jgi:hypothetical protein
MAGSRRWFQYTSDKGFAYAVELDESTYETPALGFTAIDQATVAAGRVLAANSRRPISMRYVNAQRTENGDVFRRKFFVGALEADPYTGEDLTLEVDGETWSVTSVIGERKVFPPLTDTANTDGDVDTNIVA